MIRAYIYIFTTYVNDILFESIINILKCTSIIIIWHEMYSPSITETQDEMSIVGRKIQLTRTIQQVMQHLNKEVEGQLLRRPHVRMEN